MKHTLEDLLVDLESPFAGDIQGNLDYAREAMRDCLLRGEYPIASHLLYTQEGILDDSLSKERSLGIAAGKAWARHAHKTVVYTDRGISPGMQHGIDDAIAQGRPVEYRSLHPHKDTLRKEIREYGTQAPRNGVPTEAG